MTPSPLEVLYEDAHCLVVSKQAGAPTQGLGVLTVERAVRAYLCPDDPGGIYLGTVHRLDRPVTGVLLWAKNAKAARRLAEQFALREARKVYWALVEGDFGAGSGLWQDWLCTEDTGLGRVQVCHPATPRARQAITRFRSPTIGQPPGASWLVLEPETGRTHQLRVQAATRGWPIVGDRIYGATREFPEGIALHARSLTFVHPILRQPVTIEAPPPASWETFGFSGSE